MTAIEDIDNPKCYVCDKAAKKRKLILPIRNKTHLCKEDACLCEDCFFRCPEDLHKRLISNADQQSGAEFNTAILEALSLTSLKNLNDGYVGLVKEHNGSWFRRFGGKTKMLRAVKDSIRFKDPLVICFKDGKEIFK
jgi:hypothetical protein